MAAIYFPLQVPMQALHEIWHCSAKTFENGNIPVYYIQSNEIQENIDEI